MDNSKNKMLIDSTHPEETRVVVLRNGRVEEFDWESAARKLLRGNIYLAKVTRVEPSLQAAFIDYGGNRHGFLAFGEIHPDYYQIPVADREALLREEEEAEEAKARAEADADDALPEVDDADDNDDESDDDESGVVEEITPLDASGDTAASPAREYTSEQPPYVSGAVTAADDTHTPAYISEAAPSAGADSASPEPHSHEQFADSPHAIGMVEEQAVEEVAEPRARGKDGEVETVGSEDAVEELPDRPRRFMRQYKIQEVIRRRQIILVQVVKEERGNKGAALTTYLSLAGRYTVLMPNTARGGGISRKITNPADRKRLRKIVAELEVPKGMGLIVRTAGASRTKAEIQRDFEYLLRLWENVRDLTLRSTAPALVYEEGDLIKRSIRDLYTKEIDEIVVAGDHAFKDAHNFMKMLMPSHAGNVLHFRDPEPLFSRFNIERQLDAMFSPFVTLRSGGYIVINQTEALVSVDVNSGKSTREHNIEDTAVRTNLEAAEEISRQLKLRDLAGLIVIDFIDMEEKRNNRAVERKLKECLRNDRARIQVGRISHFGLMEMSRQRLRPGVLEGSTSACPHCQGTGIIRSTESVALAVLRGLEDKLNGRDKHNLVAHTTADVALYLLNQKRQFLNEMEARHDVTISILASDKVQGANFIIERGSASETRRPARSSDAVQMDWTHRHPDEPSEAEVIAEAADDEIEAREDEDAVEDAGEGEPRRRSRRRRRRRGRNGQSAGGERSGRQDEQDGAEEDGEEQQPAVAASASDADTDADGEGEDRRDGDGERTREGREDRSDGRRSRRRGRRGGRRNREREPGRGAEEGAETAAAGLVATQGGYAVARPDEWFNAAEPTIGELAAAERRYDPSPAQLAEQPFEPRPSPSAEVASEAQPAPTHAESIGSSEAVVEHGSGFTPTTPVVPVHVVEPETTQPPQEPPRMHYAVSPEPEPSRTGNGSDHVDRYVESQPPVEPAQERNEPVAAAKVEVEDDNRPRRSGWWQRRFSS